MDFISIDENIFPIDWILFLSAVPVVSRLIPNTKLFYPFMIESLKMLKMQMIVGWFSIVNSLKIYSYIGYETF